MGLCEFTLGLSLQYLLIYFVNITLHTPQRLAIAYIGQDVDAIMLDFFSSQIKRSYVNVSVGSDHRHSDSCCYTAATYECACFGDC